MANYQFVVDSTFNPFNMQEMLVPFSAYKNEFEKSEAMYEDLSDRSDKFKYLSETLPEGSKSRQIYEGYANDLRTQAEDLAHNGLTMGNRRALTSLKRRFQGEMGRVLQADEAMREEKKLRRSMLAQDSSLLYANDNLNIDDFLDGNTPNLYSISGNELYTRGAAAGKAASSRVFSAGDGGSTLGGYFRDYVQKMGYNADTIKKFREDMSTIPELKMAADAILEERGVNQNLTGYNLRRARQSVIDGMIDGAIYQENHSPQRDLGVIDAATKEQLELSAASQGMEKVNGKWQYNSAIDPSYQKALAVAQVKAGRNSGSSRTSAYDSRNKDMIMIGANSGKKYRSTNDDNSMGLPLEDLDKAKALSLDEMTALVDSHHNVKNDYLRNAIGDGNISDYEIYVLPQGATKIDGSDWLSDDYTDEDIYILKPRDSKRSPTDNSSSSSAGSSSDDGSNEIPH